MDSIDCNVKFCSTFTVTCIEWLQFSISFINTYCVSHRGVHHESNISKISMEFLKFGTFGANAMD